MKLTVIDDVLIVSFKKWWVCNSLSCRAAEVIHDTSGLPYTYKGEAT